MIRLVPVMLALLLVALPVSADPISIDLGHIPAGSPTPVSFSPIALDGSNLSVDLFFRSEAYNFSFTYPLGSYVAAFLVFETNGLRSLPTVASDYFIDGTGTPLTPNDEMVNIFPMTYQPDFFFLDFRPALVLEPRQVGGLHFSVTLPNAPGMAITGTRLFTYTSQIPEPSSLTLSAVGLLLLIWPVRRLKRSV